VVVAISAFARARKGVAVNVATIDRRADVVVDTRGTVICTGHKF
jgi:hypothetical protein